MAKPRIAVNGFGRIGRLVTRALLEAEGGVDLVAINDLTDRDTLAHLFRYDSVHGRFGGTVEASGDTLVLDGDRLRVLQVPDPADLPWAELRPDVVIESSGRLRDRQSLEAHRRAGAPRVLVTAPTDAADVQLVPGVNDAAYDPGRHRVVSNASCTTNCLAPVLKVLHESFGVEEAMMTTVHAVTNDQSILDLPRKDLRRSRASLLNMIPTSTGAAAAIGKVLPELDGRVSGLAVRVPVADVSLVDLTARLRRTAGRQDLADALCQAADGPLAGILGCEDAPLVSSDFTHDPRSAVVDLASLDVQGDLAKVLAWYDNEWAYASRVAETAVRMAAV